MNRNAIARPRISCNDTTLRAIGTYALRELLGRGGASEVYAAEHADTGDIVAIKLLRTPDARRLAAEVARTTAIRHANVVRVLDAGIEGDVAYLVMELVVGEDLATRLRRDGRLDERTARSIGAAIADGAGAAHACGIVHRDLKPANVMIESSTGTPKLVDFGIAKQLGDAAATGPRMGTPAYMAPEQLVGNVATPFVDIFALGVVLYELVTGTVPFDCTDGAAPQLATDAPRVVGCSAAYADLVARCLARDPARRPASMSDVARALRGEVVERVTESLDDRPLVVPPMTIAPARSRRVLYAGLAVLALLVGVVVVISVPSTRHDVDSDRDPVAAVPHDAVFEHEAASDAGVTIAAEPAMLAIEIRSRPPNATIIVDGTLSGKTPATISVKPNASITLTLASHEAVTVRAERAGVIDIGLVFAPTTTSKPPRKQPPPKKPPKPAGERLD